MKISKYLLVGLVLVFGFVGFANVASLVNQNYSQIVYAQTVPLESVVQDGTIDPANTSVSISDMPVDATVDTTILDNQASGTTQPESCGYVAPDEGYQYVQGPDFDITTGCGMVLEQIQEQTQSTESKVPAESLMAQAGATGLTDSITSAGTLTSGTPIQDKFAFVCNDPLGGQTCAINHELIFNIPTSGNVSADYKVPVHSDNIPFSTTTSEHCSSLRIFTYVDGILVGTTPWLGWLGGPEDLPMTAQLFSNLNLTAGDHTVRLSAEGAVGGCNHGNLVSWGGIVNMQTVDNSAPIANAGLDQNITFPTTTSAPVGAEATDSDGTVASTLWSFTSGPAGAIPTISNDSTLSPSFSGLTVPGIYVFTLIVTDDKGTMATDSMTVTVNSGTCKVNSADIFSDTSDIVDGHNAVEAYSGHTRWTASIEGATWIWSSYLSEEPSAGGTKTFSKSFDISGTPVSAMLQIAADNRYRISIDSSTDAFVSPGGINYTIGTQDLFDLTSYLTSGANTLVFQVTNDPFAGNLDPLGNPAGLLYKLHVESMDCGGNNGGNHAPIANAGPDKEITLPTNSTTLDGSGSSDSDGTIASYVWTMVSGPSDVNPDDVVSPNITGLVEGTYVFELTVTDNQGATATDRVTITVSPENNNNNNNNSSHHNSHHGSNSGNGQVLGASTGCGIYVDEYLRVGYKNDVETVKKVQQFLNNEMGSGLEVNGIYGTDTEAAVSAFQLKYADKILAPWGLTAPTGIFYLTTQTEVNNIICPSLNLPIPEPLVNWGQNPNGTPPVVNVPIPLSYEYFMSLQ